MAVPVKSGHETPHIRGLYYAGESPSRAQAGRGRPPSAAELARRLGIAHVELDALHHGPNWSAPTTAEFRARVHAVMEANPRGWVIDGNYERKLDKLVTDAAEVIVWLDLPLWTLLRRLWSRTVHRIRDDVELWNGNRETWRDAFWGRESLFAWTIRADFRHRREWPRRFASHPGFVRVHTSEEARGWLDRHTSYPMNTATAVQRWALNGEC